MWHVAHGNVLCVANLSKTSVALLELELARDGDLAVVDEVVGRLVQQLRDLPDIGPTLIGEPSIVGVTEVPRRQVGLPGLCPDDPRQAR